MLTTGNFSVLFKISTNSFPFYKTNTFFNCFASSLNSILFLIAVTRKFVNVLTDFWTLFYISHLKMLVSHSRSEFFAFITGSLTIWFKITVQYMPTRNASYAHPFSA